jgi:hypothetical protein
MAMSDVNNSPRACKTMLVIALKKMWFRYANTMQISYIRARTLTTLLITNCFKFYCAPLTLKNLSLALCNS